MDLEAHRQLPYDVDVEQALLGAILIDNYSLDRASQILRSEHFYDPLHQRLYSAVERMWSNGHLVTPLTLKSAMEQDPGLAEVGGKTYLDNLARAAPVIPNVKDYARILADLAMRPVARVDREDRGPRDPHRPGRRDDRLVSRTPLPAAAGIHVEPEQQARGTRGHRRIHRRRPG